MADTGAAGGDGVHLLQLPDLLRRLDPPVPPEVLALVVDEHAHWRQLHDRLIALIAGLLDIASQDQPVEEVIDRLIAATEGGLDQVAGRRPDPVTVAALLRAHGSTGDVRVDGDTTAYSHECGSGLRYWRDHPHTPTVADSEVTGVPAGRPRYCARCIRTIETHAPGSWSVTPPADPSERCTWRVTCAPAPDSADG